MKYYWVVGSPVGLGKLGGFEPSAREKINTPFILDFFKNKAERGGGRYQYSTMDLWESTQFQL